MKIKISVALLAAIISFSIGDFCVAQLTTGVPQAAPSTQPAVDTVPASGTETVVIFRHAEKPPKGLGQLTPQGFNRALALVKVLPEKFGKPDFLFAPDPAQRVSDGGGNYFYIRPLATIEPLAIALRMPVQTPCGYKEIDKLDDELAGEKYANATVLVAWEHGYAVPLTKGLIKRFGGNEKEVPNWPGPDFDSLYVVKIVRATHQTPVVTFTHDHENLNGQSKEMPVPATMPAN